MDHLVFPDGGLVLTELLNGKSFAGRAVAAGTFMTVDAYNAVLTTPFVLVQTDGGTPGFVDQVERLTLQVNAPAGTAKPIADAIRTGIVGENIDTSHGFVDNIKCDRLPTVTSPSDQLDQAILLVSIVTRPID